MATFLTHPLFGAGAAYVISHPHKPTKKFVLLSTLCQWLPDIDTVAYLFPISERHALGHRGLAHSGLFAVFVALLMMRFCYREVPRGSRHWWALCGWFWVMTLLHGIFDAMVDSSLGVAFFWPFTSVRYNLPWQPLIDVPIVFSALYGSQFWYAVLVECQFFSLLLVSLFVLMRVLEPAMRRSPSPFLSSTVATATKQS
jgi:inner membrane protein